MRQHNLIEKPPQTLRGKARDWATRTGKFTSKYSKELKGAGMAMGAMGAAYGAHRLYKRWRSRQQQPKRLQYNTFS